MSESLDFGRNVTRTPSNKTSKMSAASSTTTVQEYNIRVPKNVQKRYHVMRFNGTLDVDFSNWSQVKMERENNMKEFKSIDEDQPKFGAGSEFGREAKEEARRKKLGIVTRKYKADDQPWILKSCGSSIKKFKGIREGGVSENASYYVFTHAADGAIEAFPLHEWYKFQPIQRYKALSAEEAEQEFSKRNKHLNFFSLMLRKRLKGDEDVEHEDDEEGKPKKGGKAKELKISEMDEWMDSSDDDSSEGEEKPEEQKEEKKKKKQSEDNKKKKKKRDTDAEAFEESDDGDGEGRELDYISDSSNSEPEDSKLEGVSEEKALRKLLNSDEDDSENDSDKSDKEQSNEDEDNKEKDSEKKEEAEEKEKAKKSKKKKKDPKKDVKKEKIEKKSEDDFSSDSSTDEDAKKEKPDKKGKKAKDKGKDKESHSSRSGTPTTGDGKRKIAGDGAGPSNKKPKLENPLSNYIPGASESGITEDAVRKYLMRKPMTTTELLQKFKSKKTGLSSEQLVNIMTQILKKINPVKQTLKGKMYLSIKS